jgi:hypothetical protein
MMDASTMAGFIGMLRDGGPWAIVVMLGWTCWRQQGIILTQAREQTAAIVRFHELLSGLKESIERLADRIV